MATPFLLDKIISWWPRLRAGAPEFSRGLNLLDGHLDGVKGVDLSHGRQPQTLLFV